MRKKNEVLLFHLTQVRSLSRHCHRTKIECSQSVIDFPPHTLRSMKVVQFSKVFHFSPLVLWKIPAEKCFSRVNETWEVENSRQSFVCRRRLFAFCYLSTAHRSQSCSDCWGTAEVKMFINFELFLFYFSRKTLPLSSEVEESFSRSNKPWISTHFNAELKQERRRTCKH